MNTPDLICGVDKSLVEKFLTLIVRTYPKADEAHLFLEERARVTNVVGMSNLRDVLSHLVTLVEPGLSDEHRVAQLATAEEHLRRAVIEPYQLAIDHVLRTRFDAIYEEYCSLVEPLRDEDPRLSAAPSRDRIGKTLKRVRTLVEKGRKAKGRNLWDKKWEDGVSCFIEAYDILDTVMDQLTRYLNLYHHHGRGRTLEELKTRLTQLEAQMNSKEAAPAKPPRTGKAVVIFCDLKDSTWFLTLTPIDSHAELFSEYIRRITQTVNQYGGHLVKFTGDGALAYFEINRGEEREQARRALACAMDIPRVTQKYFGTGKVAALLSKHDLGVGPGVRVAAAEGTVTFLDIAGHSDIIGRKVVEAQRLCAAKDLYGDGRNVLATMDPVETAGLTFEKEWKPLEKKISYAGAPEMGVAQIIQCTADKIDE